MFVVLTNFGRILTPDADKKLFWVHTLLKFPLTTTFKKPFIKISSILIDRTIFYRQ